MSETDTDYLTPQFITVMGDHDGHARWVAPIDATDVINAYRTGGIYLLVTLDREGNLQVAFKPGRHWEASWSPPISLDRK
jgi:hypothetical protein